MRSAVRTACYAFVTHFPRIAAFFAYPVMMLAMELLGVAALCYKAKGREDVYEGILRYLEEVT